jgi:hypothetical protein
MALQSASASRTASNNAFTGLTYVNSIITGATTNGLYSVIIEGNYLDDSLTGSIISSGYTITKRFDNMGTYPKYLIGW